MEVEKKSFLNRFLCKSFASSGSRMFQSPGVPHNYISESMGHSVDTNITNRYIDVFPLAQQMEFNSRLLKLNDDADILEELKGTYSGATEGLDCIGEECLIATRCILNRAILSQNRCV